MVDRIVKLFSKPAEYWEEMVAESGEIKHLLVPGILILAAIPTAASLVGGLLGWALPLLKLGIFGRAAGALVFTLVVQYALSICTWLALGYIIDLFANTFGAQRDLGQSMKLATGTMTPIWLGQALAITTIPALGMVGGLAGLGFGCYLLYKGLPLMNGTPEEKAVGYVAASMGCLVGVMIVVSILTCIPMSCCVAGAFIAG